MLIIRHFRVENEHTQNSPWSPEKGPSDHRSVLEDEGPFHSLDPHPIFDSVYERLPRARKYSAAVPITGLAGDRDRAAARSSCPSDSLANTRGHMRVIANRCNAGPVLPSVRSTYSPRALW